MPSHAGTPPNARPIKTIEHRPTFIRDRRKFDLRATLAGNAESQCTRFVAGAALGAVAGAPASPSG